MGRDNFGGCWAHWNWKTLGVFAVMYAKTAEPYGGLTWVSSRNQVLDGVKVGRIHLRLRGVTRLWCVLSSFCHWYSLFHILLYIDDDRMTRYPILLQLSRGLILIMLKTRIPKVIMHFTVYVLQRRECFSSMRRIGHSYQVPWSFNCMVVFQHDVASFWCW